MRNPFGWKRATLRPPHHDEFDRQLDELRSPRRVRPVVTPSGKRARGLFPSLKADRPRWESLVEEDAMRVLEVAPAVLAYATHPLVLRLSTDGGGQEAIHYTPDLIVYRETSATLLEVKGDWLLREPASRRRLRSTLGALRERGVAIALISETDVRPAGLQDELKALLRVRPVGNRFHQAVDPMAWDPLGRTQPTGEELRRWRSAQRACDALLDHVMRRDPDAVIDSLS